MFKKSYNSERRAGRFSFSLEDGKGWSRLCAPSPFRVTAILAGLWCRSQKVTPIASKAHRPGDTRKSMKSHGSICKQWLRDIENKIESGNKHRKMGEDPTKGRCTKVSSREPWPHRGETKRDTKMGTRMCSSLAAHQENYQILLILTVERDRI